MLIRNLEGRAFVAVVILVTAFFLWIISDLLMPVFWAIVLAVLFQPMNRRILNLVRGRTSLAAAITTILIVLIIIVPFGLLATAVTQQALSLFRRIASGEIDIQAPIESVERALPMVDEFLSTYGLSTENLRAGIEEAAMNASQYLATEALAFGRNAVTFTLLFGVMLYVLFFFIRDWQHILENVVRALPLGDDRERRLMAKVAEVSRATIKGTLVVAVVQGLLGGITFGLLGIEASVLWGVTMGLLSLLPAVGPPLVWIPASIILIVTGSFWKGVILILVGTFVIGLVDNFLRPILVGRDTRIPDYLVLIATLGGITVFGIAGVIAGPLVAGLFLVVWDIFAEEHANRSSGSLLRDYAGREIRSVRIESGEPAAMVDEPAQAENPTNDPARED